MNQPLVSIVIPVYNGSNYLDQAIDSALAQTYPNTEILVVNDGSKDDGATERIALSYGDKIRYFSKENGGVSSALNLGIREMRGEYFSWLSHDDLYTPDKIEKQVALLSSENDIILCSGSLMDADGKPIRHHTKVLSKKLNGRELFTQFLKGYVLNGLGFLIPRQAFETVGMFDESMRYLQDLDLWLQMMWCDFSFVCHSDLLVVSRIHRAQATNTQSALFDTDRYALAKKHIFLLSERTDSKTDELLKLYYFLFVKGENKPGAALAENQLKERGLFTFSLRREAAGYYVKRLCKQIYRTAYGFLLKLKKERD